MGVPLRSSSAGAGGRRSTYREWAPADGLSSVVSCTWEGHAGWARPLRVLPDGCVDLTWDGTRLAVVSAGAGPLRIDVSASQPSVGIRLRCGVAGSVLGPGFAATSATGVIAFDDLFPVESRVRDALEAASTPGDQRAQLTQLIAGRLRAGFGPNPTVLAAVGALGTPGARVDDVADQVGISVRSLRRRVSAAVGCGPKELQRILRFRRATSHLSDLAAGRTTLATVAAMSGFVDQAHLGRECRRLSGSSPGRLVASWARHGAVAEIDQTAAS